MHFSQAVAIVVVLPMRKLSEAFSPKRRKTDANGDNRAVTSLSDRMSWSKKPPASSAPQSTATAMGSAAHTQVYESDVRLHPSRNCLKSHGKGKDLLPLHKNPDEPTWTDCGYSDQCCEGYLFPESAEIKEFRLTTGDPVQDLKRWFSPNQRITGGKCIGRSEAAQFFKHSPRFSDEHFRECIVWAVEEIKHIHNTVRVQLQYLGEEPYEWAFFRHPIHDACPLHTLPTQESLEGLQKRDLVQLMEDMAVEIDYVCEQMCAIRRETLILKWDRAKQGDWGEISELVDFGFVSEAQVQRLCQV